MDAWSWGTNAWRMEYWLLRIRRMDLFQPHLSSPPFQKTQKHSSFNAHVLILLPVRKSYPIFFVCPIPTHPFRTQFNDHLLNVAFSNIHKVTCMSSVLPKYVICISVLCSPCGNILLTSVSPPLDKILHCRD